MCLHMPPLQAFATAIPFTHIDTYTYIFFVACVALLCKYTQLLRRLFGRFAGIAVFRRTAMMVKRHSYAFVLLHFYICMAVCVFI